MLTVGDSAFADCAALETVVYNGTESQWKKISVGENNQPLLDAAFTYEEVDILYGDVNGDNAVDISDANDVLQYYAGWEIILGPQ